MKIHCSDHPLIQHHLTLLRDQETPCEIFRHQVSKLTRLLAFEATRHLDLQDKTVQTPVATFSGKEVGPSIGIVPILRAGLGMVDPILDLLPMAQVWHLGLYRDEQTANPVEYYSKLPPGKPVDVGLIVDPMLATGGSAELAYQTLKNWGVKKISLLSIIAAPEGTDRLSESCPDLELFVCSIDQKLNEQKFIVPGLGDAGDRIFRT